MTNQPPPVRPVPSLRRWATHPLVPVLLFTAGAMLAAAYGHVLTWAVLGGLAGYTLSGSV
ncbi:hypothetical protein NCC78_19760 [Micromonospora phytophila]|uniref:hypothetical protein n=1 Tax=Micromonospora phytophila TaxID=709888 RepID=UPI00202E1AC9|nr:hypothetical protein [Micromonospora phytophila]MCM0676906.1 hypothetical protein [Micromonospora phytophila]